MKFDKKTGQWFDVTYASLNGYEQADGIPSAIEQMALLEYKIMVVEERYRQCRNCPHGMGMCRIHMKREGVNEFVFSETICLLDGVVVLVEEPIDKRECPISKISITCDEHKERMEHCIGIGFNSCDTMIPKQREIGKDSRLI